MLFGWLRVAAGALMLFDILQDGRSVLALDALAVIPALEGLVAISAALVIGSRPAGRCLRGWASCLWPFNVGRARRR